MQTEWKHQNASGGGSIHRTLEDAEAARLAYEARRRDFYVDEPPPPPSVGIFRREVTEWVSVDVPQ